MVTVPFAETDQKRNKTSQTPSVKLTYLLVIKDNSDFP